MSLETFTDRMSPETAPQRVADQFMQNKADVIQLNTPTISDAEFEMRALSGMYSGVTGNIHNDIHNQKKAAEKAIRANKNAHSMGEAVTQAIRPVKSANSTSKSESLSDYPPHEIATCAKLQHDFMGAHDGMILPEFTSDMTAQPANYATAPPAFQLGMAAPG